nr:conserved hypothetical protein [Hymenolepis microstoma]
MRSFEAGPMRILVLVLKGRFNKRREPTPFKMVDEPLSEDIFNFTKIKPRETLFHLNFKEIENCDGKVIANASPFEFCHSLIVPNCDKLYNQVLRKFPLHLALKVMLLSANDYLCLGFNSLLAYASVNHLHFHIWYSTHRLYASVCPTRRKENLPLYTELDFHPVDNFVFEFNSHKDFQETFERLWNVIERCQELQIAHNLFAARNASGVLRVVFWSRRSAFEPKACLRHLSGEPPESSSTLTDFDVAVAELAGMLVVPDASTAQELTSSFDHLIDVYLKEKLEKHLMSKLEEALQ